MAYPNYPAQYPYPQPTPTPNIQTPAPTMQTPAPMVQGGSSLDGRRWVQGEIGALSYYVTDNTVVTLWDSTDPEIFYEKSADVYGKPVLKKYRRTEIPLASSGVVESDIEGKYATQKEYSDLRKEYDLLKKRIAKLEKRRRLDEEYDGYDSEDQ